jgi:2-C-methyl-D-erythritol 2,4-cyclodiphosphate synthase
VIRVGLGYDVHALVPGRPLKIGGVQIASTHGLLGHSDADVLLHAITDALLGAAGLGDIGRLFPDHDPALKDADSLELLRRAAEKVRAAGWTVGNVDAVVVAQRPRIAPYVAQMQRQIAPVLGVAEAAVGIKGKTSETLGFTGRGEGIAAQAVALLVSASPAGS